MSSGKKEYIPYTDSCFACGARNLKGLRLKLYREGDFIKGDVTIDEHLNGYRGIAHGGVVCSLLDEAMIWAAVLMGSKKKMYVTTEISVKYLAPVPVLKEISLWGRVVGERGRVAECEAGVTRGGELLARGRGKFLALTGEQSREAMSQVRFDRSPLTKEYFHEGG